MATITELAQTLVDARTALEAFHECVRVEQVHEARLEANPDCPLALRDYEISAAATTDTRIASR
jgi:hypothetical protein